MENSVAYKQLLYLSKDLVKYVVAMFVLIVSREFTLLVIFKKHTTGVKIFV